MKKTGICKRLLALLLALVLTLSVVPGSVYAAIGDVSAGKYAGTTGLSGNIDTANSISWPIKIYDYLNDGMLFEYAAWGSGNQTALGNWVYAGGERMPAQGVRGYDFTINGGSISAVNASNGLSTGTNTAITDAYDKATYKNWWGNASSPFTATPVGAGTAGAFKYMRITLKSGKALRSMPLTGFYFDTGSSVARDLVRYAVIVYRTNITDPSIKLSSSNQTVSGADSTLYDFSGSAQGKYVKSLYSTALVTSSDTWVYQVIDMKEVVGTTRWNNTTSVYTMIIDIEKMAAGGSEYLDISHVAYFSDVDSATNYGKDASKFSNNPGEYLPDQREVTTPYVPDAENQPDPVDPPTGYSSYCLDMTKATNSTALSNLVSDWTTNTNRYINATKQSEYGKYYYNLTDKGITGRDVIRVFYSGDYGKSTGIPKSEAKYVTVVYRTHGMAQGSKLGVYGIVVKEGNSTGNFFNRWETTSATVDDPDSDVVIPTSESEWVYFTYDMSVIEDSQYYSNDDYPNLTYLYLFLPGFTSSSQSMDLAYVDFFGSKTDADTFGVAAAAYMNDTTTTTTTTPTYGKGYKHWNMSGNTAFTMLFGSQGGGWNATAWTDTDGTSYTTDRGGANSWASGYYSYPIGKHLTGTGLSSTQYKNNITRDQAPSDYVVSDSIFSLSFTSTGYQTNNLAIGYQLLTKGTAGLCTIGLLESSLATVKVGDSNYKILQYKDDTIDYIAQVLESTLTIPETDIYGNYNYSFIKGSESSQFAYTYDPATGKVTEGITVDGETQTKVDLATGLRTRLGIQFRSDKNKAVAQPARGTAAGLSATKRGQLIGDFKDCLPYIETFADAAYYLLHNLFVDNAYSQVQDEYNYLVLSKATTTAGKEAYVFDGGFSTGTGMTDTNGDYIADGTYAQTSQSAVVYDKTAGTISLSSSNSKDLIFYQSSATTTRFPFLPITDSTGDYEGPSDTYFAEDAATELKPNSIGYRDRNYNYVMQANGEFVYHVDDGLFFDFEGDDDVYLFVNGELVLDIGGAHSITKVGFNMNDYVDKARSILVNNESLPGYYTGMSESEFKALLDASSLDDATKEEYLRWYKLDLADGQSYPIDFYYMERHGYGANMRIATNIVMTDPSMQTNKTAYQNGEEIPYGGVADKATLVEYGFSITNSGNNKLYDLSFTDSTIGVKLDKTSGLTVSGAAVKDKNGGALDVSDLVINISGYSGPNFSGPVSVDITLDNLTDLKKFMEDMTAPGTQTNSTTNLYAGSGLWKDGTLTIRGIYVDLNKVTIKNDQFSNTVETTAATAIDSATLLSGKDTHMLRTLSGGILFYQWAGHEIGVHREYVFAQLSDTVKSQFTTLGSFYMDPCMANGTSYSWPGVSVNDYYTGSAGNQGTLLNINFKNPGKNVIFLKLYRSSPLDWDDYVIIPVTIYVTDVEDSTLVLDYGLKAELTGDGGIYANDYLTGSATSAHKIMGITSTTPSYMEYSWNEATGTYQWGDDNRIDFTPVDGVIDSVSTTGDDGNVITTALDGEYSVEDGKLYFTPTAFMDDTYTIYAAVSVYEEASGIPHAVGPSNYSLGSKDTYGLDISKEVQMFQQVTVLPASVVYYEDDFGADSPGGMDYSGSFTKVGDGSGDLLQSVNQSMPYGQDPVYQESTNTTMSGNSLHTYTIKDNSQFASFTFKGTGFEIIGQTNAMDSGTMVVKVVNSDGETVHNAPVITEFDNTADQTEDTDNDVIHQVPVVRVDGLDYGTYTVTLSGSVDYEDYDETDRAGWVSSRSHANLQPITMQARNNLLNHVNCPLKDHTYCTKYNGVTRECLSRWVGVYITQAEFDELKDVAGVTDPYEACPLRSQRLVEWLGDFKPDVNVVEKKLYIDGVRIFQPYGENVTDDKGTEDTADDTTAFVPGSSIYYNAAENGATIEEVRNLLVDGKAAIINRTSFSTELSACTSNMIWTENRNGSYTLNRVGSVDDYLVVGPNNELYFRRYTGGSTADDNTRQMLLLYVTEEDGSATGSLQFAVRAIDEDAFKGTGTQKPAMDLFYIKLNGADYAEGQIGTTSSSTEQYYTIDYTTCPYTTVDGKKVYKVMLYARTSHGTGMLSITSLKHNGLAIQNMVVAEENAEKYLSGTEWYYKEDGTLVTEAPSSPAVHFDMRELSQTMDWIMAAEQAPAPEIPQEPDIPGEPQEPEASTETNPGDITLKPLSGAVNQPPAKKGPSVLTIILLSAGIIALLAVTYLLTKKYLHYL